MPSAARAMTGLPAAEGTTSAGSGARTNGPSGVSATTWTMCVCVMKSGYVIGQWFCHSVTYMWTRPSAPSRTAAPPHVHVDCAAVFASRGYCAARDAGSRCSASQCPPCHVASHAHCALALHTPASWQSSSERHAPPPFGSAANRGPACARADNSAEQPVQATSMLRSPSWLNSCK